MEERTRICFTLVSKPVLCRNMGIAGGHAYTVLGLAGGEEGGKLPRLVKIRNPWGNSFEWRVRLSSSKSP